MSKAASTAYSDDDDVIVIENTNYKFQQVYTATWEIREFKKYFQIHLENSSKDGTELCPIRNYLIETGEKIGLPCKWIAGLYIHPLDEDANNNDPKVDSNFNIRISMRLVDAPIDVPGVFSNCRFITRVREVQLQKEYTLEKVLEWSKWHTLFDMDSTFCCTFEQHVYRAPLDWGLTADALDFVVEPRLGKKLSEKERRLSKQINQTCIMHDYFLFSNCNYNHSTYSKSVAH
ncbi:Phosphate acyltransferase [Orchesella cincta]|uniref:Phosphate acyltransferase n=1 Tax=Orchesella cincta TaxID=48709 RepID=A0A1D2N1V3_ORCCI|nr:Phosphate acyltransferase [Orchesella cincta]